MIVSRLLTKTLVVFLLLTSLCYANEKKIFPEQGIITFQGLDDTSQPPLARDSRAADLQNIVLDVTGSAEKRYGYSLKNTTLDTVDIDDDNEAVTGLWELYKSNGTRYFITVCGNKIFYDASGTWTDITGSCTITEGKNYQFQWITALDYAIGTNGLNPPIQWNGTSNFSTVSFTGGTFSLTSAKCVTWWKNYLIFGNTVEGGTSNTTRIRWSNVGTIGTWSDNDYVDIATLGGQQIEGFGILYDNLYIFLTDSIYAVSLVGGDELINVSKISEGIGCIAKNSIQTINIGNTQGLVFLSRDKTINYLDGVKVSEVSSLIRTAMEGLSTTRLPYAVSVNDGANSHYYISVTDSSDAISTTSNNLILDYYYQVGEWSKHSQIDANAFCIANDSNSDPQVYFGNYSAFVYQMNNSNYNDDVAGYTGTVSLIYATSPYSSSTNTGLTIMYDEDLSINTKLLCHFEGINGSNNFIDEAEKTINSFGNSQISTSTYKFGSASGLFDGSDNLTVTGSSDWAFGTGDFAVDFWLYLGTLGIDDLNQTLFDTQGLTSGFLIYFWDSATPYIAVYLAGSVKTFSWSPTVNTWYHVAVTRDSGSLRVFIDGTQIGTTQTLANDVTDSSTSLYICSNADSAYYLKDGGRLDEVRISNGVSRWTADFTPPTSQYTNSDISSRFLGGTVRITSGTGIGGESVIVATTISGIAVTSDLNATGLSVFSIGDIDSYYTTKWYDCGNAAILKNFGELYIWSETQQSQTMQVDYATEQSSTIQSQNVDLYGGDTMSGTGITGTSTWAGIQTNFNRIPVNVSGRFIKTRFRESDINATMKLYGYGYLYWTRSEP